MELICFSVNSCTFFSSDFMLLVLHLNPIFSSKMKKIFLNLSNYYSLMILFKVNVTT